MGETRVRKPDDLVMESLRDACYPMEGSIDSVQLVADTTREEAIERFARDVGVDESQVACYRECARILTRQETWERAYEGELWHELPPGQVPDDWEPEAEHEHWVKCRLNDPGATRIYLLEVVDA